VFQAIEPAGPQRAAGRRSLLHTLAVAGAVSAIGLLGASCGGSPTAGKVKPAPSVTVTVTVPGPTVTETVTPIVTPTVEPSEESLSESSAPPEADPTPVSDFDRAYAIGVARDMIRDVKSVDGRLGDGIGVSSGLSLLSGEYGLENAGTPPGVDAAKYHARLRTLESFSSTASDMYLDDPTQGAARYAVVREETGTLLSQLNSALGTDLRLPQR
jgi:hypothetical protein